MGLLDSETFALELYLILAELLAESLGNCAIAIREADTQSELLFELFSVRSSLM